MSNLNPSVEAFGKLVGGIPTKHQDFGASIFFAIAFAAVVPFAIWRLVRPSTRSLVLIRPTVFLLLQVAAYVLRALIANGDQSTTLYIIAQVFLLSGFILICEPVCALLTRVVGKSNGKNSDNEDSKKTGTQRLLTLCRLALIAALVLGIIGATSINGDMSQSDINSLDTYRKANAGLVIGAMIVAGGVAAVMIHRQLVSTAAFIIMVQTVLIMISAIYKLITAFKTFDPLSDGVKACFYIFNAVVQWVIVVLYFVPNLEVTFPDKKKQQKRAVELGQVNVEAFNKDWSDPSPSV